MSQKSEGVALTQAESDRHGSFTTRAAGSQADLDVMSVDKGYGCPQGIPSHSHL